jgi:diaminohydroxyphosphoribosylaminopyrimidine deaminase / 5-amino-6-(5-phosphoribosylamino)uracil reductase
VSETTDYMARALALADSARGRTSPNPSVGAVIVRGGQIVGEGYTQPPGGPHAEIVALRQAGELARGATLFSTLEPCCHFGRTPPCTRAIVEAGISEVRVGVLDPNPLVEGRGCAELSRAGLKVVVGERAGEASELIEDFAVYATRRRPFVVAKWAMTLDGKIATRTGESRWITGQASRQAVHRLRDTVAGVMVGSGTVVADDPELTVRLAPDSASRPERAQPWRIVVDGTGRTPLGARLLSPALASRTIVGTTDASPRHWREGVEASGARLLLLSEASGVAAGRVDLRALLEALWTWEVMSVLVEGGGSLLGSLFDLRLVDKVWAFVAPAIFGGEGRSPVGGEGVSVPAAAIRLERVRQESIGGDLLVVGYPAYAEGGDGSGGGESAVPAASGRQACSP